MNVDVLRNNLEAGGVVLLDGGMGTEISSYGITTTKPAWSALAPLSEEGREANFLAHLGFIDAGALINTTNTFRTQDRTFKEAGIKEMTAEEATLEACKLAILARARSGKRHLVVAGSAAPLADCYRTDLTPPQNEVVVEQEEHVKNLAKGGVDLILAETMITLRETNAVLEAARKFCLPVAVSFCVEKDNGENLLSGESLEQAVEEIDEFDPVFVAVNCVDINTATLAVAHLKKLEVRHVGVYGQGDDESHPEYDEGVDSQVYAEAADTWLDLGAQVIGGCCGVSPEYIREIRDRVTNRFSLEPQRR